MGIRPRSEFMKALKLRRCSSCGGKLNNQVTRCKRCSTANAKPKKIHK